jgi:selenium-binding protein 1
MALLKPDPTFHASPGEAAAAPPETLGYVVTLNTGTNGDRAPDALSVVDLDPASSSYGTIVGRLDMPEVGDELHHFGWNACSSALCPWAAHPHVERRYLLIPGLRSSRLHVVDVKADRHQPKLEKVVSADEIAGKAGYSRPHTIHCGPDGIYVSALGAPDGDGPTTRASRSRAPGSRTADRRSSPTTSGGTSATTRWSAASGGRRTWSRTA